jgi:predicted metal-binding protein
LNNKEIFKQKAQQAGYTQVVDVDLNKLSFDETLLAMCAQNACGHYGTSWTCPPGSGEMSELKEKVLSYKEGVLVQKLYTLEDSFDFEGMMEGSNDFNTLFYEMSAFLKEEIGDAFYALKAGGCDLCEQCTYPDAPCIRPDDARPSIEACGINVSALCSIAGIPYIYGPNTVAYDALFLF